MAMMPGTILTIGFTKRLIAHLDGETSTSIPCYLDGPYGISHSYTHHDSVMLIAGTSGAIASSIH